LTSSGRRTARWPVRRAGPSDTRPATGRQGRAGIAVFLVLMIDSVVSGPSGPPPSHWSAICPTVSRVGTPASDGSASSARCARRAMESAPSSRAWPCRRSRARCIEGPSAPAPVCCWQQHCCSRRPCRGRPCCLPRHVSLCLAGVLWALWACLTAGPLWLPRGLWVPCLAVAVLCCSAAQLVHSPVADALSADAAPADLHGRYMAVIQYSFAIGTVVAPLLFSVLFEVSSAAPWLVLAALALLTIPGMPALAPRLPQSAPASSRRS